MFVVEHLVMIREHNDRMWNFRLFFGCLQIILGDILAYEGKFMEAEKLYCRNSKIELAIQMYSDLWKYDEAKRVARVRFLLTTLLCRPSSVWCGVRPSINTSAHLNTQQTR